MRIVDGQIVSDEGHDAGSSDSAPQRPRRPDPGKPLALSQDVDRTTGLPDLLVYGQRVKMLHIGAAAALGALLGWRAGVAALAVIAAVTASNAQGTAPSGQGVSSGQRGGRSMPDIYNGGSTGTVQQRPATSGPGAQKPQPGGGSAFSGQGRKLSD